MFNFRSLFAPKKKKLTVPDPAAQSRMPEIGQMMQGAADQKDTLVDPLGPFKKRVKANSPGTLVGSLMRKNSAPTYGV